MNGWKFHKSTSINLCSYYFVPAPPPPADKEGKKAGKKAGKAGAKSPDVRQLQPCRGEAHARSGVFLAKEDLAGKKAVCLTCSREYMRLAKQAERRRAAAGEAPRKRRKNDTKGRRHTHAGDMRNGFVRGDLAMQRH